MGGRVFVNLFLRMCAVCRDLSGDGAKQKKLAGQNTRTGLNCARCSATVARADMLYALGVSMSGVALFCAGGVVRPLLADICSTFCGQRCRTVV